ncbi:class D sortase [Paenibacillus filicis]|uniref:Class D sortase n=1 Tax=Paenibacillus filicis TaxID=669464 RepID=A0ABU9DXM6_9BACL
MMKGLAYVLMVAGIVVVLLPKAMEWHADYLERQLLKSTEQSFAAAGGKSAYTDADSDRRTVEEYARLSGLFSQGTEDETNLSELHTPEAGVQPSEASDTVSNTASLTAETAIAVLSIEKIKLRLPVLEGATQDNMKFAAAHMKETSPLGEPGNAAIAAHRVRTKGRLFNRLDELKIGDEIIVETKDRKLTYTVYKTLIVKPTDTSVLRRSDKESVLTLITCEPIVDPTHRLIVQARRS